MTKHLLLTVAVVVLAAVTTEAKSKHPVRPRVLISTDIGGTDPDDNQSMIHLLMYANDFDIEGLVSSPSFGSGSKGEILRMIGLYEQDYPKLRAHVPVMAPDSLRRLCKQGRRSLMPYRGYGEPTEGSEWIVRQARQPSDRPLWVLVWGTLDDVAQALHDAPDIAPRIRVNYIGGPNKKWGVNSHAYVAEHFPDLWMIEDNSTYRGFITKNSLTDGYNTGYYDRAIRGCGALGADFINYYDGVVKMGDTPTLLYLMYGNPDDPASDSWGGCFASTRHTARRMVSHPLTVRDTVPVFSVIELHFRGPVADIPLDSVCFRMTVDRQEWDGYYLGDGDYAIRYAPKAAATLTYATTSSVPALHGLTGTFVVSNDWPGRPHPHDYHHGLHWYTDRTEPALSDGPHRGAVTTLQFRNAVLDDWAQRWNWLRP